MRTRIHFTTSAGIARNAEVRCSCSQFGRVVGIVLEPDTCQLTHLIVRERGVIGIERMVPVYLVGNIDAKHVDLICSRADIIQFEVVNTAHHMIDEYPDPLRATDDFPVWSHGAYSRPPLGMLAYESVPYPTIILRMGARVVATNGLAGRVTGVMMLPDSWQLTHVRIQQRQPWGFKSFSVPATTIARLEEDAVFLDVSKADIERKQTPMRLPI